MYTPIWDDGSPVEEEHLEEYFTQRYAELEHEMLDFEWEDFIQSKIDAQLATRDWVEPIKGVRHVHHQINTARLYICLQNLGYKG